MSSSSARLATAGVAARVAAGTTSWRAPFALIGALGVIVWARWAGTRAGLDPYAIGFAFGLALLAVALAAGHRLPRASVSDLATALLAGVLGGLALVGIALLGSTSGPPANGGPASLAGAFGAWAGATVLVASAEEILIRGALFDRLERAAGAGAAIVATSIVFAVLHVPLYGWHVVPLDLGAGLVLGGLRALTGGVLAPAITHAIADLVTWWL